MVTFLEGNVYRLQESAVASVLESCAHPLLVIEDGPHTYEACYAALEFFHSRLGDGDYIVVEDGIVRDLGYRRFKNGPNRAIKDFISENPDTYEVDRSYCDFFGRNATWNTNGYLRRLSSPGHYQSSR